MDLTGRQQVQQCIGMQLICRVASRFCMFGARSMYVLTDSVHVPPSGSPDDWRWEGVSALGGAPSEVATYRPSGPFGGSRPARTPNGPLKRAGGGRRLQIRARRRFDLWGPV